MQIMYTTKKIFEQVSRSSFRLFVCVSLNINRSALCAACCATIAIISAYTSINHKKHAIASAPTDSMDEPQYLRH